MAPGWLREFLKHPPLVAATAVLAFELVVVLGPHVHEWLPHPVAKPTPSAAAVLVSPGQPDVVVPVSVPSQTPVLLPNLGAAPPGLPLIWLAGANGMVAYSWQGNAVGVLHSNLTRPSPDGQLFWTGDGFVDPRGHLLDTPPMSGRFTWARGSDGVCGIDSGGKGVELWTYRLGSRATVSVRELPASAGGSAGDIAGCSFQRDLALVTVGGASVADLYWIRLHDGALLGHRSYAPNAVADVVASPDLRYFAEDNVGGPHPGNRTQVTTIRRVADGGAVASRDDLVLAFSADGTEIVTGAFNAGTIGVFSLTGRRLWAPSSGPADWAQAAPSGAGFAMTAEGPDGEPNVLQLVVNGAALPPIAIPNGASLLS